MDIKDQLVQRRNSLGLTQAELAERVGITQPTISEFESGLHDPLLSTLSQYARALGGAIKIDFVTGDQERPGAGWFADIDREAPNPDFPWQACLDTNAGIIEYFGSYFPNKEECEEWIKKYVLGLGMVDDE